MKATVPWLAAALAAALAAPAAHAQSFGSYPYYGACYCPTSCGYPGGLPFNGMVFAPGAYGGFGGAGGAGGAGGGGGTVSFPTHPYARSPRDYFMVGTENPYELVALYPALPPPPQPTYIAPVAPVTPPTPPAAPPGPPLPAPPMPMR